MLTFNTIKYLFQFNKRSNGFLKMKYILGKKNIDPELFLMAAGSIFRFIKLDSVSFETNSFELQRLLFVYEIS